MTITRSLAAAVAALALAAGAAPADQTAAAMAAAEGWLKLVDAGRYGESWDGAAPLFRNAVSRDGWEKALKATRAPLGKVVSRKVIAKTWAESLPGAPDGTYVVVQYRTSYERKESAIETVTPMLDEDGRWRVSGYFIK